MFVSVEGVRWRERWLVASKEADMRANSLHVAGCGCWDAGELRWGVEVRDRMAVCVVACGVDRCDGVE